MAANYIVYVDGLTRNMFTVDSHGSVWRVTARAATASRALRCRRCEDRWEVDGGMVAMHCEVVDWHRRIGGPNAFRLFRADDETRAWAALKESPTCNTQHAVV